MEVSGHLYILGTLLPVPMHQILDFDTSLCQVQYISSHFWVVGTKIIILS
jgi:hypothetical protein